MTQELRFVEGQHVTKEGTGETTVWKHSQLLRAPTPVLHMSAPVHRGAVADARLGLA